MKRILGAAALFAFAIAAVQTPRPARAADSLTTLLRHCSGCNFSHVDWHGRDLRDARFSGVNLDGADLRGADLRNAHFAGVDFRNVDLRNADLRGAHFAGCNFRQVKLEGAKVDDTHFAGIDLSGGVFDNLSSDASRAILSHCAGCNLHGVNLSGRDLRGIRLNGSNLRGADLHDADLRNANLVGSDARDARLAGADLDGAVLCGEATEIDVDDQGRRTFVHGRTVCTDLLGADLRGAKLHHIQRCVWSGDGGQETCTEATPQMLRDAAHADLTGAQFL